MYQYHLYGLKIHSEVKLPGVPQMIKASSIDLEICYGKLPLYLQTKEKESERIEFVFSPEEFFLKIPRAGSFWVKGGKKIIISPSPENDEKGILLLLFNFCLGIILHQRKTLVFHGSCVQVGDFCVGFLGDSGAGKSTLVAALADLGYPLVCDEVCAIENEKSPQVFRGASWIQLSKESLELLHQPYTLLPRVRDHLERYRYPVAISLSQKTPLVHLFHLEQSKIQERQAGERQKIDLKPLHGIIQFQTLLHNVYRRQSLEEMDGKTKLFFQVAQIAKKIPLTRLEYFPHSDSLQLQVEKVLEVLHDPC